MPSFVDALDKKEIDALLPSSVIGERDLEKAARKLADDLLKKNLLQSLPTHRKAPTKRAAAKASKAKSAKKSATSKSSAVKAKGSPSPQKRIPVYQKLWTAIKVEFHLLICTSDRKYRKLRTNFTKLKNQGSTVIAGTISAAIASTLGAIPGIVTPFVLLLLTMLISVGKNVFCQIFS